MNIIQVSGNGWQRIIYRDGDYFYEDGSRVPEEKRNSPIFKKRPNQKQEITPEEEQALVDRAHARLKARNSK